MTPTSGWLAQSHRHCLYQYRVLNLHTLYVAPTMGWYTGRNKVCDLVRRLCLDIITFSVFRLFRYNCIWSVHTSVNHNIT